MSECTSVNGVIKSKLTITSARGELRQAAESADPKKISAATMIDGELNSPAQEYKRCLVDLEGSHGDKSNREGNIRESGGRAIQQMHYIVRQQPEEKLYGLKYNLLSLSKDLIPTDLYHVYACPELGLQRIAMRRVPWHYQHCRMPRLRCKRNVDPQKQP